MTRAIDFLRKTLGRTDAPFEALGLRASELRQMKMEDVFLAVLDALSKIPNEAERAAKTIAVFGRSGQDLSEIIERGLPGMDEFRKRLTEIGALRSEQDIAKLNAVQTELKELRTEWEALKADLAGTAAVGAPAARLGVSGLRRALSAGQALWQTAGIAITERLGRLGGFDTSLETRQRRIQRDIALAQLTGDERWLANLLEDAAAAAPRTPPKAPVSAPPPAPTPLAFAEQWRQARDQFQAQWRRTAALRDAQHILGAVLAAPSNLLATAGADAGRLLARSVSLGTRLVDTGERMPILEGLVQGTREASIAAKETLRPQRKMEVDVKRTADNTGKTVQLLDTVRKDLRSVWSRMQTVVGATIDQ